MSLETQYKTVQACTKPMPTISTGESAKDILAQAREVYGNPKYQSEAGYAEFEQVYAQKLQEGYQYCGGKAVVQEAEPTKSAKWLEAEATLKRIENSKKFLTQEQLQETENIIKRIKNAMKFL